MSSFLDWILSKFQLHDSGGHYKRKVTFIDWNTVKSVKQFTINWNPLWILIGEIQRSLTLIKSKGVLVHNWNI